MSSKFTLDIGDFNKHNLPRNLLWTLMQGYVQQLLTIMIYTLFTGQCSWGHSLMTESFVPCVVAGFIEEVLFMLSPL